MKYNSKSGAYGGRSPGNIKRIFVIRNKNHNLYKKISFDPSYRVQL